MLYVNRCLGKHSTVKELQEKVEFHRKCELYNAKRTKTCKKFYKKWSNYSTGQKVNANSPQQEQQFQEFLCDTTLY